MKARILPLTLLVLALLLPWATGFSGYILYLLGQVGVNALAALGLNLLMGLAGQISLGHAGFVAIGAYVSVLLEMRVGLSFLPSLLAALIACALLGAVIGLPALRLSGFYLAVVTMAFGLVTTQVITNLDSLTGGPHGIRNIPWPKIASLTVESDLAMYFLILAFLLLGLWFYQNIRRSRTGRALQALRDNELSSQAFGIHVARYKLIAFVCSAVYAGLSGVLYAHQVRYINPNDFSIFLSLSYMAMIVIGGLGFASGALMGSLVFTLLPYFLTRMAWLTWVIQGFAILFILRLAPFGLVGAWNTLKLKMLRPGSLLTRLSSKVGFTRKS
jgi:branched-chain amino acid transport system permease protein